MRTRQVTKNGETFTLCDCDRCREQEANYAVSTKGIPRMDNKEVAHLWANRSKPSASGSHFFFEGDTIYSYGSHFPIARHCKGVVLFTTRGYSNSTARHKGYVSGACSHLTVFHVPQPTADPGREELKAYQSRITALEMQAGRARNPHYHLQSLEAVVDEANAFARHFGFKTTFKTTANLDELKARARLAAERERKLAKQKAERLEREAAATVAQWLAGESVRVPWSLPKVYLRKENEELVTSKGARVPLPEAERAFRFATVQRKRGWHRNGDQFAVGNYHLDAVNEFGVIAGCHRIPWDEIERFATLQDWI